MIIVPQNQLFDCISKYISALNSKTRTADRMGIEDDCVGNSKTKIYKCNSKSKLCYAQRAN